MQTPPAPPSSPYPGGSPAPQQQSPYDFFLQEDQPKRSRLAGGGSGFKILIIAVIILVILGILAVVLSSAGSKKETPGFTAVASDQLEIIRVADLGAAKVNSPTLRNFAVTTSMSVMSANQELLDHIGKRGGKVDLKQLTTTSVNSRTDELLNAAAAASTYDATFKTTMEAQLTAYQSNIQKTYNGSTVESDRTILSKNFEAAKLLLQMLSQ